MIQSINEHGFIILTRNTFLTRRRSIVDGVVLNTFVTDIGFHKQDHQIMNGNNPIQINTYHE